MTPPRRDDEEIPVSANLRLYVAETIEAAADRAAEKTVDTMKAIASQIVADGIERHRVGCAIAGVLEDLNGTVGTPGIKTCLAQLKAGRAWVRSVLPPVLTALILAAIFWVVWMFATHPGTAKLDAPAAQSARP